MAVEGLVGDGDPLVAIDDAVFLFDPHEIVVSTHPEGRSHWLARRLVDKVRVRHDLPVLHIVVDTAAREEYVAA
jgi:hypothetical protein